MTLLQDLPDLLVETHWDSVDGSIQPASPQPLALSFLPLQMAVSWTVAHRGQDPTGSGGAAATLWWQQKNTVRKYLINIQWYQCRSNINLISMHSNVLHVHKVTVICSDREVTSKMYCYTEALKSWQRRLRSRATGFGFRGRYGTRANRASCSR